MQINSGYIAYKSDNSPITHDKGNLGIFIPVYDNPMSAMQWGQSTRFASNFYVQEVTFIRGEKFEVPSD